MCIYTTYIIMPIKKIHSTTTNIYEKKKTHSGREVWMHISAVIYVILKIRLLLDFLLPCI